MNDRRRLRAVSVFLGYAGSAAEFHRGIARFARNHADWTILRMGALPADALDRRDLPRVDGLLVNALNENDLAAVVKRGLPAVTLYQTDQSQGIPVVCADNHAAGQIAAEHLLGLGLRRLGYVSALGAPDDGFRRQGFLRAAKAAGADCRVLEFASLWERALSKATIAKTREWINAIGCPCGILAFSDILGVPFIQAARAAGFRVPDDVAVVGMDDDDIMCEYANPPLSSVNMNYQVVGYEAAAMLDRIMRGQRPIPAETLIAPIGVIERGSSQMLAVDEDVARVLRMMLQRLEEPITVRQMAEHIHVSRRTLGLKFQRCLGRSPSDELTRLRMERAKRLLIDTETSVSRIAMQTGFTSPGHFCRVFKQKTGAATPGQHRRARRGSTLDRP